MYKILDGCGCSIDTACFLKGSNQNRIIITDQLLVETFKSGSVAQVKNAFNTVSGFESQILLTKPPLTMLGITPIQKGLRKRYIDNKQTERFREFLIYLNRHSSSDINLNSFIDEIKNQAQNKLLEYKRIAKDLTDNIKSFTDKFTQQELRQLRSTQEISKSVAIIFFDEIQDKATQSFLHSAKKSTKQIMKYDFLYSFNYRWILCLYLHLLGKIKDGADNQLNPNKLVNDLIDMELAALGTIYDGVISGDNNLKTILGHASWLVKLQESKFITR